jgi:hypothetical protein
VNECCTLGAATGDRRYRVCRHGVVFAASRKQPTAATEAVHAWRQATPRRAG